MRGPRTIYTKVEQPAPIDVVIPYTRPSHLLQTVVDCLRIQQVQPQLHRVGDDDSYWQLLRDRWEQGRSFFVVEQDVIVWQGALRQLDACEQRWCTLPTMCHGRMITTTFGCVKFGAGLIERYPGFWDDIPSTWFHLDAGFADKIGWPYIRPHAHWPPASHLNEVQWADEISTRYMLERKVVWQAAEHGQAVVRVKYRIDGDGEQADRIAPAVVEYEGTEGSTGNGKRPDQPR